MWWYEALILLALYAGYVTIMAYNEKLEVRAARALGHATLVRTCI